MIFDSHHDYPHLQFHLRSSRSPQHHSSTRLHPARIILNFGSYLISPLIPSIPINARQPSTTKILDKRTTWILVNNTIQTCYDHKPTSWPPIKIAYAQPTNLDPLPIGSNIEQTLQPKNDPAHAPPVNHKPDSIKPRPQPRHESPCLWASLSIEHNQRSTLPIQV